MHSNSASAAVQISPPLLLTARVSKGSKVSLFSLDATKLPASISSLRRAEMAQSVRVKEVFQEQHGPSGSAPKTSSKQSGSGSSGRRSWLTLMVREALSTSSYDPLT